MAPLVMKDVVPLCMHQYVRAFGTSRVPGVEEGAWLVVNNYQDFNRTC